MNINQKQEFRYQYAGMALQAMITAAWSNKETQSLIFESAKRHGFSSLRDYLADEAVGFADALIAELDRKDKP